MIIRSRAMCAVVVAGLVAVAGCQGDAASVEHSGKTSLALTLPPPPTPTTFDLAFPAGYGLPEVAIAASRDVLLGPNDHILAIDGSPGNMTNAGGGPVTVGSGTSAGSIVSVGNIVLLPLGINASTAQSAGTVSVGLGDHVTTVTQHATLTPLAHRTMTVPILNGTAVDFVAAPGSSTLAPGLYDDVNILPGATVTLSAGNYVIDDFVLSPLAQLVLDTSQGAINVFVKSTALWGGSVTGDGTRFVFSYLGSLPLTFAGTFTGTALAPNAALNLGPLPASYSGNFYGQHVVLAPGVTVHQIATPFLLNSVAVSNTTPCVGQETEVTVDGAGAGAGAILRINGIPGGHQFVQFAGAPGKRLVAATVVTPDGRADSTTVPFTVQQCTPAAGTIAPVALHFWPTPNRVNEVEFMVHDYDAHGQEVLPSAAATYAWNFGDGKVATTTSPLISHDYTSAISPMAQYNYFDASVTVTTSAGATSAQKIVPILSVYAASRANGVVQPPTAMSVSGSNLVMTVTNYETTPLSITSSRIDLVPCDPSLDAVPQAAVPMSVTIAPSATAAVNVPQPSAFSPSICQIGVHLFGTTAAGVVYAGAYNRVKENPLLKQAVTDPNTIALLNQASTHTADPNSFDELELRQLFAQGILTQLPAAVPAGSTYANPGDECTPGDQQSGLVCQPTADWVVNPGELLNAFKGDFVIHHACGDMIADLLAAIGQDYSHSMTVSKNRVEVRHSTANEDRMSGSVNYVSGMLDAQKMQFGYPGTAGTTPYSIDQMINGYCVSEPNGGSGGSDSACPGGWHMTGNLHQNPSQCSQDVPVVYPLVIRPPPDATAAGLQAVSAVGDQALSITGHYRFFMYSRSDEFAAATSGPSWAVGTEESVCSLFDLESTRHAGAGGGPLQLQTPRSDRIPDGMRTYSVSERTAAANTLYSEVFSQAEGQLPTGWQVVLGALTGGGVPAYIDALATNVANQLVNCFATDACSDTTNTWTQMGTGVAVSPDDIRKTWTMGPTLTSPTPVNGTYGFNEPLAYAPTSFRHKYAWVKKAGDASLTVQVVDGNNNPFPNATVILNSTPVGTTDSMGTLVIPSLDQGTYDVEAQAFLTPPPPPSPPPAPPTLSAAAIEALPACSAAPISGFSSPCSVFGASPTCPNLWSSECIPNIVGSVGGLTILSTCACFAPNPPLQTCDLAVAERPKTVPASGNATVELTLCTAACQNGVPGTCPQHCASNDDCDNNFVCSSATCVAPPRVVNIQSTSMLIQVFDNDPFESTTRIQYSPSVNITCDPNASPSGGTQTFSVCEADQDGSDFDEFDLTVQCQEDASGGIVLTNTARLQDECGSNADDEGDTQSWTVTLVPATSSNPNPSASQVGVKTCYSDDVFPPSDACTENEAAFDLLYTSNPHP